MPLEDPNFLLVQRCGEAWEAQGSAALVGKAVGWLLWVKLYHIVPPPTWFNMDSYMYTYIYIHIYIYTYILILNHPVV